MLGNLGNALAGLLGTITGLIKAFAGVAGVDPSQKATLLSKGISEAMNCTAFGLTTGIIGLAAFAWLNGRTQTALDDIAEVKKNVANLLFPRPKPRCAADLNFIFQRFQPDRRTRRYDDVDHGALSRGWLGHVADPSSLHHHRLRRH